MLVVPLQPVWVWVSGRWPVWPVTNTSRSSSSSAPTYGINFSNSLLMPHFRKTRTGFINLFELSAQYLVKKFCLAHLTVQFLRGSFGAINLSGK